MYIIIILTIINTVGEQDYSPLSGFPVSLTAGCINQEITIIQDSILENNETFTISMISEDTQVVISENTATFEILNDDSK